MDLKRVLKIMGKCGRVRGVCVKAWRRGDEDTYPKEIIRYRELDKNESRDGFAGAFYR